MLILDESQQVLLVNQAFCKAVGISADQLVGTRAGSLGWVAKSDSDNSSFPWTEAIRTGRRQTEKLLKYQHPDGTERVFSVNCSPISSAETEQDDEVTTRGALATFRDVTQIEAHRAEMNSRIRHLEILAAHDPLTECLNRRALVPKMQSVWDQAVAVNKPVSCLMIDNDHFKQINDTCGHEAGDTVLRKVAEIIRQSFSKDALVCRYGGEEFCVALPDTDVDAAAELAETIRQLVATVDFEIPSEVKTTISIGVSETRFGASNPQELITQADQCLYLAKQQGRNRVVVMSAAVVQLLQPEQPGQDRN